MENKKRKKIKSARSTNEYIQSKQRSRMYFDDVEVPQVVEPRPDCCLCGQPIELISEAISEPNGGFSHFDCVIEKLKEREHVIPPDSVSYVGHGSFAVVSKDENGNYVIKNRIQYESNDDYSRIKKQVEEAKR